VIPFLEETDAFGHHRSLPRRAAITRKGDRLGSLSDRRLSGLCQDADASAVADGEATIGEDRGAGSAPGGEAMAEARPARWFEVDDSELTVEVAAQPKTAGFELDEGGWRPASR
jgi:hypothetical protein